MPSCGTKYGVGLTPKGKVLAFHFPCKLWSCIDCRLHRLRERLAVIEDEIVDEPVYLTTCPVHMYTALYLRLKRRSSPFLRVGWENDTVSVIHTMPIATRVSGFTFHPEELTRHEAVVRVLDKAKTLRPKRVQGSGRWKYEPVPLGISHAITGSQSRVLEAMDRVGITMGQYVEDQTETIALLESAYAKTVDPEDEVDFP